MTHPYRDKGEKDKPERHTMIAFFSNTLSGAKDMLKDDCIAYAANYGIKGMWIFISEHDEGWWVDKIRKRYTDCFIIFRVDRLYGYQGVVPKSDWKEIQEMLPVRRRSEAPSSFPKLSEDVNGNPCVSFSDARSCDNAMGMLEKYWKVKDILPDFNVTTLLFSLAQAVGKIEQLTDDAQE